jgi:hypothetical protein
MSAASKHNRPLHYTSPPAVPDRLGCDSPIFVVGAPRSGTTMMRLILNAHPHIAIPPETSYFPDIYWRYAARNGAARNSTARNPALWPQAVDSFTRLCEARFRPTLDLREAGDSLRLGAPDFGLLLALPLTRWATAQGKGRWGEKTPLHIFYADVITRLFPAAKIVALQRDPRAVVASLNRFVAAGNDTVLNARLWRDAWTRGRAILDSSVPAAQRLTVRYEDLVGSPEQVILEVCEFLGEDFSPAMLAFGETASGYIDVVRSAKIQQPIHADPAEWRHQLSDRQVALVERICGSPMTELGYTREGRALRPSELAEVAVKLAYVDYKQWRGREERYRGVTYRPLGRARGRLAAVSRHHHGPTG